MGERAPVTLLMAMHCHQPIGNFGFVFEEAYAKAYEPFLTVLERHPGVRLALHYSGCLLDWLTEHRPEFLRRLRALVERGQVELLASGYYEPILPLIPEADRQGQIARMRRTLRARCQAQADGLWLTERVWEPDLPATLAKAGIRYTMVDTNQFASAKPWLPVPLQVQDDRFWDLLGCYATEYGGHSVTLFPASKRLRYWMPFEQVGRTIEFLKRLQREEPVIITFADDGEKFGLWPKTHQWVYTEGWLDQFFTALERERSWLATSTFHDHLEAATPDGRVYLPCGSYEEMLEWSGGHFRNFFAKYPEANAMQQKMLRVSRAAQALGETRPMPKARAALLEQAVQELHAGQCNCAYWHGVFGGLYLSHLRRAVYAHLIAAEALLGRAAKDAPSLTKLDADGDGREEIRIATAAMSLVADPSDGGAITEWNLFGPKVNLLDTLTRRPEPYHEKLKSKQAQAVAAGGEPASIHDLVGAKEQNLESRLIYDDHRRAAFLDYGLQQLPTLQDVVRSTWGERRLWSSGPFQAEPASARGRTKAGSGGPLRLTMSRAIGGGRVHKTIEAHPTKPVLECRYRLEGIDAPVLALEFNLALRDERYLAGAGQVDRADAFRVEEPSAGVALELSMDRTATLYHFPIETVSESEEGLERTYQGLCVVLLWALRGDRSWAAGLRWTVKEL